MTDQLKKTYNISHKEIMENKPIKSIIDLTGTFTAKPSDIFIMNNDTLNFIPSSVKKPGSILGFQVKVNDLLPNGWIVIEGENQIECYNWQTGKSFILDKSMILDYKLKELK